MKTAAITRNDGQHLQSAHVPPILQHEIVEVLLNAERIQLIRFLPPKEEAEDCLPVSASLHVRDLGETASVRLAMLSARERMDRRKEWRKWLFATLAAMSLACSAYLIGQQTSDRAPTDPAWRVTHVTSSGVTLAMTNPAGDLLTQIPVGGVLPDGQRLMGVDASRQIYSTNLQDVRVRHAHTRPPHMNPSSEVMNAAGTGGRP